MRIAWPGGRRACFPSSRVHGPITRARFKTFRVVENRCAGDHRNVVYIPARGVAADIAAGSKMKGDLHALTGEGTEVNGRTRPDSAAAHINVICRNLLPITTPRTDFNIAQGVHKIEPMPETQPGELVRRWNHKRTGAVVIGANEPGVGVVRIVRFQAGGGAIGAGMRAVTRGIG